MAQLLIFQTPSQRTWLVCTQRSRYVQLDDLRTRAAGTIIQGRNQKDLTRGLEFDRNSVRGTFRFGPDSGWWFYSSHLYGIAAQLKSAIEQLVETSSAAKDTEKIDRVPIQQTG